MCFLCFLLVCRHEESESSQAAWLSEAEDYENSHLGSYRRIYPACGTDKYEPFFKQSSSLFKETVSSKAREECTRYIQTLLPCDPFLGVSLLFKGRKEVVESWIQESLLVLRCHGKAASVAHNLERQMQYSIDFWNLEAHVETSSTLLSPLAGTA